jgi:uncharacterized cupin superfamily protein
MSLTIPEDLLSDGANLQKGPKMLITLALDAQAPEISRPDPGKVTSGAPVHRTWNHFEKDGLFCGIWQSTPGAWRVAYDEFEYINILSGHSVLRSDDGGETVLKAGTRCIIPPGFSGVWEVIETTTKDYVIQTCAPAAS